MSLGQWDAARPAVLVGNPMPVEGTSDHRGLNRKCKGGNEGCNQVQTLRVPSLTIFFSKSEPGRLYSNYIYTKTTWCVKRSAESKTVHGTSKQMRMYSTKTSSAS